MIPVLNRNATYKLNIPDMAGGVNFRDGLSLINDNQMTDCKNMWYKDGMLKSRPRVLTNDDVKAMQEIQTTFSNDTFEISVTVNPENTTVINKKEYVLEITTVTNSMPTQNGYHYATLKYQHGIFDKIDVATIYYSSFTDAHSNLSCFAVQHNGDIYVYGSINENGKNTNYIHKIARLSEGKYDNPIKVEGTVPLLITNGYPKITLADEFPRGTQVQGYNLLAKDYKQVMSAYDYENPSDYCTMAFALMEDINNPEFEGRTITAKLTQKDGTTITHTATIKYDEENNKYEAWEIPLEQEGVIKTADGLEMHVSGKTLRFYEYDPEFGDYIRGATALTMSKHEIKNNLEITAPCFTETEYQTNFAKVTSMTKSVWYGNTSLGLNGGSRLFLAGSTLENEKALVVWSDFENPLYFSENAYAYVGDKSQKITAFGRQSASLIIFKEREIYSTQYTQGSVTAEELENQQAIDLTVHLATFPMVMIHSAIGCNCPDSVQLCRNRLVWADTNGKIYTMTAQSQYSERNVFEIGEMVERGLKKEKLSNARSVDWKGHYILFIPNSAKAYVMDYNSYGFANVASYNKHEDANMLIPFFVWQMPFGPDEIIQVVNNDEELLILTNERLGNLGGIKRYLLNHHILNEENAKDKL